MSWYVVAVVAIVVVEVVVVVVVAVAVAVAVGVAVAAVVVVVVGRGGGVSFRRSCGWSRTLAGIGLMTANAHEWPAMGQVLSDQHPN